MTPAALSHRASEGSVFTGRRGGLEIAAILLGLVPLFLNLGLSPSWKSEGRWLCIAAHMLETGNYFEPTLHGEFYGDKPLLSYWAITALAGLTGRLDEQVARLSSALSAAGTVLITAWMAGRLLGRAYAIPAAWILTTAYSFFFWSRLVSSDLLSLLFSTGAIAVYLQSTFRFRPWQPLLFFVLLALGGQSKGLPGIIVPIGVAIAHGAFVPIARGLLERRGWRRSLCDVLPADRGTFLRVAGWSGAGLILGVVLYALPFILSRASRGDWGLLALMWKENFVRALDAFDHVAPVFYYVYTLPAMFLPWSLWFPGALGWAGKRFRDDSGLRFALTAFVVIFCAFTASESRRSYYILPIFPFAAILVSGYWIDVSRAATSGDAPATLWRLLAVIPCVILESALVLVVLFALGGGLLPEDVRALWSALPHPLLTGSLIGLGFVAVRILSARKGLRARLLAVAATTILVSLWLATDIESLKAERTPDRRFAVEVQNRLAGSDFLYFRTRRSSLCYYLGEHLHVDTVEQLLQLLRDGRGEAFLVCRRREVKILEGAPLEIEELARGGSEAIGRFVKGEDEYFLFRCRLRRGPGAAQAEDAAQKSAGDQSGSLAAPDSPDSEPRDVR